MTKQATIELLQRQLEKERALSYNLNRRYNAALKALFDIASGLGEARAQNKNKITCEYLAANRLEEISKMPL